MEIWVRRSKADDHIYHTKLAPGVRNVQVLRADTFFEREAHLSRYPNVSTGGKPSTW